MLKTLIMLIIYVPQVLSLVGCADYTIQYSPVLDEIAVQNLSEPMTNENKILCTINIHDEIIITAKGPSKLAAKRQACALLVGGSPDEFYERVLTGCNCRVLAELAAAEPEVVSTEMKDELPSSVQSKLELTSPLICEGIRVNEKNGTDEGDNDEDLKFKKVKMLES